MGDSAALLSLRKQSKLSCPSLVADSLPVSQLGRGLLLIFVSTKVRFGCRAGTSHLSCLRPLQLPPACLKQVPEARSFRGPNLTPGNTHAIHQDLSNFPGNHPGHIPPRAGQTPRRNLSGPRKNWSIFPCKPLKSTPRSQSNSQIPK